MDMDSDIDDQGDTWRDVDTDEEYDNFDDHYQYPAKKQQHNKEFHRKPRIVNVYDTPSPFPKPKMVRSASTLKRKFGGWLITLIVLVCFAALMYADHLLHGSLRNYLTLSSFSSMIIFSPKESKIDLVPFSKWVTLNSYNNDFKKGTSNKVISDETLSQVPIQEETHIQNTKPHEIVAEYHSVDQRTIISLEIDDRLKEFDCPNDEAATATLIASREFSNEEINEEILVFYEEKNISVENFTATERDLPLFAIDQQAIALNNEGEDSVSTEGNIEKCAVGDNVMEVIQQDLLVAGHDEEGFLDIVDIVKECNLSLSDANTNDVVDVEVAAVDSVESSSQSPESTIDATAVVVSASATLTIADSIINTTIAADNRTAVTDSDIPNITSDHAPSNSANAQERSEAELLIPTDNNAEVADITIHPLHPVDNSHQSDNTMDNSLESTENHSTNVEMQEVQQVAQYAENTIAITNMLHREDPDHFEINDQIVEIFHNNTNNATTPVDTSDQSNGVTLDDNANTPNTANASTDEVDADSGSKNMDTTTGAMIVEDQEKRKEQLKEAKKPSFLSVSAMVGVVMCSVFGGLLLIRLFFASPSSQDNRRRISGNYSYRNCSNNSDDQNAPVHSAFSTPLSNRTASSFFSPFNTPSARKPSVPATAKTTQTVTASSGHIEGEDRSHDDTKGNEDNGHDEQEDTQLEHSSQLTSPNDISNNSNNNTNMLHHHITMSPIPSSLPVPTPTPTPSSPLSSSSSPLRHTIQQSTAALSPLPSNNNNNDNRIHIHSPTNSPLPFQTTPNHHNGSTTTIPSNIPTSSLLSHSQSLALHHQYFLRSASKQQLQCQYSPQTLLSSGTNNHSFVSNSHMLDNDDLSVASDILHTKEYRRFSATASKTTAPSGINHGNIVGSSSRRVLRRSAVATTKK